MKANYHTHTYRCHHAYGCEWEYVENAIAQGLEILGFADHAPWPFPGDYCPTVRMTPKDLPHYIATVEKMKRLYGDKIQIYCGLETEYYPELFPAFLEMLKETPGVEYLILGQHYLDNEYETRARYSQHNEEEPLLAKYVDQVVAGLETGKFLYLCHPDMVSFKGDPTIYRRQMKRLCRACNRLHIPLELNMHGMRYGYSYPRRDFWEIAGEENCSAVLGIDAHHARHVHYEPREEENLLSFAKGTGVKIIKKLPIKEDLLK